MSTKSGSENFEANYSKIINLRKSTFRKSNQEGKRAIITTHHDFNSLLLIAISLAIDNSSKKDFRLKAKEIMLKKYGKF